MCGDCSREARDERPTQARRRTDRFFRLALIGAIVAAAAGAFAYDAGVFSPHRLTQDKIIARLEQVSGGVHPGFRRNHAKGVCATGTFESSGQASSLSKAAVFKQGGMPVVARFSFGGGMPFMPDKPGAVRALALRVLPKEGQEWRTAMINMPVFPVNSARGFYDFLLASAPDPKTGQPDPEKIKALMEARISAPRCSTGSSAATASSRA